MVLYLDCANGISGDMLVAALLELAGARPGEKGPLEKVVRPALKAAGIDPRLVTIESVTSAGVDALSFRVADAPGFATFDELIMSMYASKVEQGVADDVAAVAGRLAAAEGEVHGQGEAHLHELSGLDTAVDLIAAAALLRHLAPRRVVASPPALGAGVVHTAHGQLPVPAPAVDVLLRGIPLAEEAVDAKLAVGELTTPTGAALLAHFADGFGDVPAGGVVRKGVGAGERVLVNRPNVLRALLIDPAGLPGEEAGESVPAGGEPEASARGGEERTSRVTGEAAGVQAAAAAAEKGPEDERWAGEAAAMMPDEAPLPSGAGDEAEAAAPGREEPSAASLPEVVEAASASAGDEVAAPDEAETGPVEGGATAGRVEGGVTGETPVDETTAAAVATGEVVQAQAPLAQQKEPAATPAAETGPAAAPERETTMVGPAREDAAGGHGRDEHVLLETNIDDMSAELLAHAADALRDAGAIDVWMTPALMKKGRPGTVLHVLATTGDRERLADVLFAETSTFGVRVLPVERLLAEERREVVAIGGREVRLRLTVVSGRLASVSPEYEDCRVVAAAVGRPVRVVYEAAQALGRSRFSSAERPVAR
jgi:uncharacterized protein (DUF111 family)